MNDARTQPSRNHPSLVCLVLTFCAFAQRVVSEHRYGALQNCGLGITTACMAMPGYADCTVPNSGLTAVGEARIKPVESSRVAIPWCPGHAIALVEFEAPRSGELWWRWLWPPRCNLRLPASGSLDPMFEFPFEPSFESPFASCHTATQRDNSHGPTFNVL